MVTLADLRSRDVRLHWAEAVAIVRALIELCPPGEGGGTRVPGVDEVQFGSDGTLSVVGFGPPATDAVQRVGRMFDGLVHEHELPVQLRLVVVTALTVPGPYESLEDLLAALAPFERPNRAQQIAAAYQRWQVALTTTPAPAAAAPEHSPPPPVSKLPPKPPKPQASFWKRKRFAVGVALVTAIGASGAAYWVLSARGVGGPFEVRAVPAAVTRTAAVVRDAVAAGAQAVASRIGLAASEAPTPSTEPPPEPPPARTTTRPGLNADGTLRSRRLVAPARGVLPTLPATQKPSPSLTALESDDSATDAVPAPADLTIVYSASDPDVQPPALIRPQLPVDPPPGRRMEDLPLVEVVVSERGEVESVKLLTPPRAPNDIMMLSAAKAWIFEPAIRNGVYVRCRTLVRITLP